MASLSLLWSSLEKGQFLVSRCPELQAQHLGPCPPACPALFQALIHYPLVLPLPLDSGTGRCCLTLPLPLRVPRKSAFWAGRFPPSVFPQGSIIVCMQYSVCACVGVCIVCMCVCVCSHHLFSKGLCLCLLSSQSGN